MVSRIALALSVVVMLHAQHSTTTAGRQQDLDDAANTLPSLQRHFFDQLDPAVYRAAVSDLESRISAATDAEFYVGLAQLVAMAGDMHTFITPGVPFGYPFLPLSFLWFEDGLFVVSAAPEYAQTIGTRVTAINGMPLDQVVQRLGTAFAHNNDQWLHAQVSARLPALFMLQGLGIIPAGSTAVPMTFRAADGRQLDPVIAPSKNLQVSGLPGPVPGYLQNLTSYYWYSYSAPNRMIYARYIKCADDPNGSQ